MKCHFSNEVFFISLPTLQDGYFGLTPDNPSSCTKCACSVMGSVNISCNSTGGCYCRNNFYGLKCDQIRTGFYVPSVGQLTYEAEDADISPVSS